MELLSVKNLSISFGGLKAVDNFNISIEKGQLYGLIGPNGAGKTTVFNLLTGVYQPDSGSIVLDGENLVGKAPAACHFVLFRFLRGNFKLNVHHDRFHNGT